jgi:V8-like Glu-specific endopeptidase
MSIDELAEHLRPRTLHKGNEYLGAPDYELAAKVKSAKGTEMTASYEGPPGDSLSRSVHAVIGSDTRFYASTPTIWPNRTEVWLDTGCSGTIVGPSTIISSAGCVYDQSGWLPLPLLIPAADSSQSEPSPYGEHGCYSVTIPADYNGGVGYADYAVFELSGCDDFVGNSTGWKGLMIVSVANANGLLVKLTGFPLDKSPYPGEFSGSGNTLTTSEYPWYLFHSIDTGPGERGAPVTRWVGGTTYAVVGINAGYWGTTGSPPGDYNFGAMMDSTAYNFIIDNSAL